MSDNYGIPKKKAVLKATLSEDVKAVLEEEVSRLGDYLDAEADLTAMVLEDAVQAAVEGRVELGDEVRTQLRSIAARAEREGAGVLVEGLTGVARVAIAALRLAV